MRVLTLTSLLLISAFAMPASIIYKIASKYTSEPETIVSMSFIESSYGINKVGDGGESLGILQLQVKTVLWYANKDESLRWLTRISEEKLQLLLLHDDRLSIEIASKMFEYRLNKFNYFIAISRFNGGWKNYAYFDKVQKEMGR